MRNLRCYLGCSRHLHIYTADILAPSVVRLFLLPVQSSSTLHSYTMRIRAWLTCLSITMVTILFPLSAAVSPLTNVGNTLNTFDSTIADSSAAPFVIGECLIKPRPFRRYGPPNTCNPRDCFQAGGRCERGSRGFCLQYMFKKGRSLRPKWPRHHCAGCMYSRA